MPEMRSQDEKATPMNGTNSIDEFIKDLKCGVSENYPTT